MNNLEQAKELFNGHALSFFETVELPGIFTYSTLKPGAVNGCLKLGFIDLDHKIKVVVEPMGPKTLAMFKFATPWTIYLNSNKLNRSVESIAGSLMHEFVHLVDYHVNGRFGHPYSIWWRRSKVMRSAPYWYGKEFKKYVKNIK